MPKPEMEFFDVGTIDWQPIADAPGTWERILSSDPVTGSYTRMLRFEPNATTKVILSHDFWEEVYIVSGSLRDLGKEKLFRQGMYACRPPGMKHGPYFSPDGCITVEMRYFPERVSQ
jgi:ChrR-like protein with cupin domain